MADTQDPQTLIDEAAKQAETVPVPPIENTTVNPQQTDPIASTLSSSPLIVPTKEVASETHEDNTKKIVSNKKKSNRGILVAGLLFLIMTLPVAIYYISQSPQLADLRSRAAGTCSKIASLSDDPVCEAILSSCDTRSTQTLCEQKYGVGTTQKKCCQWSAGATPTCINNNNETTAADKCCSKKALVSGGRLICAEHGCTINGTSCENDSDCCSKKCNSNKKCDVVAESCASLGGGFCRSNCISTETQISGYICSVEYPKCCKPAATSPAPTCIAKGNSCYMANGVACCTNAGTCKFRGQGVNPTTDYICTTENLPTPTRTSIPLTATPVQSNNNPVIPQSTPSPTQETTNNNPTPTTEAIVNTPTPTEETAAIAEVTPTTGDTGGANTADSTVTSDEMPVSGGPGILGIVTAIGSVVILLIGLAL